MGNNSNILIFPSWIKNGLSALGFWTVAERSMPMDLDYSSRAESHGNAQILEKVKDAVVNHYHLCPDGIWHLDKKF